MLGLDAKTLSVPDYEITARLEHLLTAVQPSMAIPVVSMPLSTTKSTSTSQRVPYQNYYQHNSRSAYGRRRSPSPVSRRSGIHHRPRSFSPTRIGIDPRTY